MAKNHLPGFLLRGYNLELCIIGAVGTLGILAFASCTKPKEVSPLESKFMIVEKAADVDRSGYTSIREWQEVYIDLGLAPTKMMGRDLTEEQLDRLALMYKTR